MRMERYQKENKRKGIRDELEGRIWTTGQIRGGQHQKTKKLSRMRAMGLSELPAEISSTPSSG